MTLRVLFWAVGLIASACASTTGYRERCARWVGRGSDELIAAWGAPLRTVASRDGGQELQYFQRGGSDFDSPANLAQGCRTTFVIGADQRIKAFSFRGHACKARPKAHPIFEEPVRGNSIHH